VTVALSYELNRKDSTNWGDWVVVEGAFSEIFKYSLNEKRVATGQPFPVLQIFFQRKLRCVVGVNKIKHIRTVCTEDTTRTGTSIIHPEGCHAGNDIGVTQEVGPAGIAIAGSTG
jgi:hypothetical protein